MAQGAQTLAGVAPTPVHHAVVFARFQITGATKDLAVLGAWPIVARAVTPLVPITGVLSPILEIPLPIEPLPRCSLASPASIGKTLASIAGSLTLMSFHQGRM